MKPKSKCDYCGLELPSGTCSAKRKLIRQIKQMTKDTIERQRSDTE